MRFDEKVPVGGAITRTALRALPDVRNRQWSALDLAAVSRPDDVTRIATLSSAPPLGDPPSSRRECRCAHRPSSRRLVKEPLSAVLSSARADLMDIAATSMAMCRMKCTLSRSGSRPGRPPPVGPVGALSGPRDRAPPAWRLHIGRHEDGSRRPRLRAVRHDRGARRRHARRDFRAGAAPAHVRLLRRASDAGEGQLRAARIPRDGARREAGAQPAVPVDRDRGRPVIVVAGLYAGAAEPADQHCGRVHPAAGSGVLGRRARLRGARPGGWRR